MRANFDFGHFGQLAEVELAEAERPREMMCW